MLYLIYSVFMVDEIVAHDAERLVVKVERHAVQDHVQHSAKGPDPTPPAMAGL
jgi:hypothetical protein